VLATPSRPVHHIARGKRTMHTESKAAAAADLDHYWPPASYGHASNQVLETLPNGEAAWLRPEEPRYVLTDQGRRDLAMQRCFGPLAHHRPGHRRGPRGMPEQSDLVAQLAAVARQNPEPQSSVQISRNAKGAAQFEVKVFDVEPERACQRAQELYDLLAATYRLEDGT